MPAPKITNVSLPRSSEHIGKPEAHPEALSRRRRLVRLYLTAMILLSLMFTLYVWQSTKIVEVKFRLQQLEKRAEALETNNSVLKADISRLQSLARIERVAKQDLGMVVPRRLCYVPIPPHLIQEGAGTP